MDFEELKEDAQRSLQNPGENGVEMPKNEKPGKGNLYIFRHCQTHDNIRRIFSGRRQSNLTEKGKVQAKKLAEKLKNKDIDVFISPKLNRCIQTLEPLKKVYPNAEHIINKNLIERNYGILTGKSKITAMKLHPKMAVLWRRSWDVPPPHGESLKDVWARLEPFCKELEDMIRKEKINVAYAGTNNTMRLIRMYFEKLSIEETLAIEMQYSDYAAYNLIQK